MTKPAEAGPLRGHSPRSNATGLAPPPPPVRRAHVRSAASVHFTPNIHRPPLSVVSIMLNIMHIKTFFVVFYTKQTDCWSTQHHVMYKRKGHKTRQKKGFLFLFFLDFWQLKATLGLSRKARIQGLNNDLGGGKKSKHLELKRVCVRGECSSRSHKC